MSSQKSIKKAFERNRKLLSVKPSKGQYTTKTSIHLYEGTSCEIKHGPWKFTADIGSTEGGNNAGPGPGILERAALGSCLAIGYSKYAALLDVPIDSLIVEVEADVDARGAYGIDDREPGYKAMRYRVIIESSAPEKVIREVIEKADTHSPVLNNFIRPVQIERQVTIKTTKKEKI